MFDTDSDQKIVQTSSELFSILAYLYWCESMVEPLMLWEAYREVDKKEARTVLFKILVASEEQNNRLRLLFKQLDEFDVDETIAKHNYIQKEFKFKDASYDRIFSVIVKNKNFLFHLYNDIFYQTDHELIQEIWKGDNPDDYFDVLQSIIDKKKQQIEMLQPFLGKMERIM